MFPFSSTPCLITGGYFILSWLVYRGSPFLDYSKPHYVFVSIIPKNHQPTGVFNAALFFVQKSWFQILQWLNGIKPMPSSPSEMYEMGYWDVKRFPLLVVGMVVGMVSDPHGLCEWLLVSWHGPFSLKIYQKKWWFSRVMFAFIVEFPSKSGDSPPLFVLQEGSPWTENAEIRGQVLRRVPYQS